MPSTPLLYPTTYFEQEPNPLPSGLMIFVLTAVGSTILLFAYLQLLIDQTENLPSGVTQSVYALLGTTVVITMVVAVISLVVVAAIMHYVIGGSDTAGSFRAAIAVAGWSYAPDLLALPLNYAITRYYLSDMTFDGSDLQELAAEMEALDGTLGILDIVLAIGVVSWSVYILAKGTAGTHDVSVSDTIIPALIIGIGSLLFRLI